MKDITHKDFHLFEDRFKYEDNELCPFCAHDFEAEPYKYKGKWIVECPNCNKNIYDD